MKKIDLYDIRLWGKLATHLAVYSLLAAVFSCAQPASPQGGARDEEPPTVAKTSPPNQSLNFSGDEVKFIFSEAIKPPQFDKEIFVSPFIKRPKVIRSDNAKRITIKFAEDLRPKTTYVITLTGIKDNTESNEMEETYTLAFSTGDVLDSMEMKGKIISPVIGKGVKDMTVMLFDADSIKNNNLKNKRPAYITKSDEGGNFEFKYLRNTPYKVYGVADQDQTNTYSQDNEKIAISEDSVVVFPDDSSQLATVKLYSFLPDNQAPRLRNFAWWNPNTLAIRFDENLRLDSLNLIMTDTLNQDSVELTDYSWFGGTDFELIVHTSRPQEEFSHLHIRHVADSLNNHADSVLRVVPTRRKTLETPLLKKPELNLEKEAWTFFSHRRFEYADTALIALTDTARRDSNRQIFPLVYSAKALEVSVKPGNKLKPNLPYVLRIKGPFFQIFDSTSTDTTYTYPLKWFNPEEYGNLQGKVLYDSVYKGPIVMHLLDKNKKIVRTVYDTTFSFKLLPADSYTAKIILDEDGNGVWTPGSLSPPRLPEKIFIDEKEISIRANWDFEDHKVQINTNAVMKTESEKDQNPQSGGGKGVESRGGPGGNRN
ncbi:MAG: Ig-like domain-containing protein [Bacteroidetes bacterium]|nr:Ig-like domain-containing protein [Bacteroidota bacterium]MCB0850624.1 Ig-like domain-containing protein [Bacteroidota bacterium]